MSHRTHGNSPASSTSSLPEPAPYASPSQPRLEGYDSSRTLISDQDRDSKAGLKLTDPWYIPYDPYTPHNGPDAGDSIPLVAVSSANEAPDQRPRSVHVVPPSRPRGWRGRFEPVPIIPLLVHALLCFAAFPIVYLVSRAASGLSLFWTRLIVGGLCGGVGLTLGVSLLDLSRSSIEAALWATIIHESLKGEINEELDYHTANPLSPWAAMLLLYRRYLKRISSRHRKEIRRHEDGTPWWLCIVLFLVTATIAASLVFVLGRVVDIYTVQQTQTKEYYEATVVGDVTPEEIARATSVLNDTLSQVRYTWTMTPLSSAAHVPTDRFFNLNRTTQKGNTLTTTTDTIHFAETFAAQLAPPEAHPSGFGTYLNQTQVAGLGAPDLTHTAGAGAGPTTKAVGQIVRWPRWGSRIGCQIIENLERYLTPHSRPANMTYLFVPRTAVDNVFEFMGLPPPNSSVFPPANFTKFMEAGDTPNVTATENEIAFMSKWWDNGVAHQFNWFPVSRGEDGNGWLAIEIVMVRLNQSYTAENSTFQVYGELGEGRTRIGFDAAICLEEVKGYVVDAYNNTAGSPVSLSLQYFGSNLNTSAQSLNQASSKQPERIGEPLSIPAQRGITSEGKWMVYNAAHYNARNIMLKDNGRDWWFVPNPTVVAFGGGITPTEYIQLNADQIAKVLSNSDSQHLLPYLVGTQPVVAHVYPDKTVAYTQIYTTWLAVVLAVVLLNGIIVSALVPRLPLGVSRKDIGVSSWLAAIEDDPSAKAHLSPVANRRASSETPEAAVQAVSGENHTTTSRESGSLVTSAAGYKKGNSIVEQVSGELLDTESNAALAARNKGQKGSVVDILGTLNSIIEFVLRTRQAYSDQRRSKRLESRGETAYRRFDSTGNIGDIHEAIGAWEAAFALSASLGTDRPGLLDNIGCAYESRFSLMGELSDLNKAIELQAQAVSLTPKGHPNQPGYLSNLGISHKTRFERLGEFSDLKKAIELHAQAVSLAPDCHPDRPRSLSNLGNAYETRFGCLGELSDLCTAIESKAQAVSLTPNGHPNKPGFLNNLGISYHTRFERLGELSDLNKAIDSKARAVSLTPDSHPGKPGRLNNLGISYETRFERLGELSDLNKAIEFRAQAVSLTSYGQPNQPGYLSSLGNSYRARFERLGELSDHNAIESQAQAVLLAPDGYSHKPGYLSNLGNSYQTRFGRLGELSDLKKAIESQAQAVSLTPDSHPGKPGRLNNLGNAYQTRFGRLGELSDLSKAIESKAQSVSLAPDGHPGKPTYLNNLGNSCQTRFRRLGEISDLNKAIELQTKAISLTPDGHPNKPGYLGNLGTSYEARFRRMGKLLDLNKAIKSKAQAVSLTPDGHPDRAQFLNNLAISYETRFECLGDLSDLNKAIESKAQSVSLTPDGHPGKPIYLNNLGNSCQTRFRRLGELSDLNKAIELQAQALLLTSNGDSDWPKTLNNLGVSYDTRFGHLGELSDLNKAIEFEAQAVLLTPDGHPDKPGFLNNLGNSYETRFRSLEEISDLNKAIKLQDQAVSLTPDGHSDKPGRLNSLGISYETRFAHLGELSDMRSAASSFRMAAQPPTGPPLARFRAGRKWARLSSLGASSSPHAAFNRAMQLLPQLVWVGTTLGRRYELIAEIGDFIAEAASYAISVASYDLALEWLEAGRSIVWTHIATLRTPFDQLAVCDPELADQLQQVSYKLEQAGSRSSALSDAHSRNRDLLSEANSHFELALSWDQLLANARSVPGFEDFLGSPKLSQLLNAAKDGPIVVINTHKSRCDALILHPNIKTISHVHLPAFSLAIATSAREHLVSLVGQRGFKKVVGKSGSRANRHRSLEEPLKNLWLGIVSPLLNYLGFMNKPSNDKLPHVTWCTTGLLSFLPLHAAGCYDQPGYSTLDYVVSSYTPTLGALLSAQSRSPITPCGILAIGQGHTPGFSSLPYINCELKVIEHHTRASVYMQLEDSEATVDQALYAMDQFSWVHMACHGTQNTADPTQSAFHLHDGPLTLARITQQSFINKGLAFLSSCQTATGDEKMPDEAVHLAAGMLMAGYPSVIGTMWSIEDEDGPTVANRVYAELLKNGKMDHTKAAWALHQAVDELRAKVGTQDIGRWAPFIHIGS